MEVEHAAIGASLRAVEDVPGQVCVYTYIYIYIYIYIHTQSTYIYIYIYIVCTPNLPAKTLLHDWPRSNRACVRQAINVRQFIHSFKAPLTRDAGQ